MKNRERVEMGERVVGVGSRKVKTRQNRETHSKEGKEKGRK